jgi:4-aminobutyrate aminotransferase/(S)-3-amino-2-methylpropionate transaminase
MAAIEQHDLVGKARRIGEIMLPRLAQMQAQYPVIGDVRGRGAMVAVELVKPGTLEPATAEIAAVVKQCHAEGVLVLTAGTYGNVLRFLPPLTMPEELLEEALGVLDKAFASLS